jgi:putative transposase
MSSKYKFTDAKGVYFITAATVGWADVFTRNVYRDILIESFKFCQKNQGLKLHAWVLMPNHFHLICSFEKENGGLVIKNIKSFTAMKMIDAIINNKHESRREWLLPLFEKYGTINKSNYQFQFWQHENHPVLLNNAELYLQRLNYLHENPVRAGFVNEPAEWRYSSAIDYYTANRKGLLPIVILD